MQIRYKLILGLTGICLLVGAVGLNAVTYNRDTQRRVRELSQSSIALNETGSGMRFALVSSQKTAQELMSESQRSTIDVELTSDSHEETAKSEELLTAQINAFQQNLDATRINVEDDLRASRSPGGDVHEIGRELNELAKLDEIGAEFVVYRNNINSFTALIKSNMAGADEVLEESVEPHYTHKLLPLVQDFKAMILLELEHDNTTIEKALRNFRLIVQGA